MSENPYTSKEVDYEKNHPIAHARREEGRRHYEENIKPYEPSDHERAQKADEEYARDMGWTG